jgi:hypothetical protein
MPAKEPNCSQMLCQHFATHNHQDQKAIDDAIQGTMVFRLRSTFYAKRSLFNSLPAVLNSTPPVAPRPAIAIPAATLLAPAIQKIRSR